MMFLKAYIPERSCRPVTLPRSSSWQLHKVLDNAKEKLNRMHERLQSRVFQENQATVNQLRGAKTDSMVRIEVERQKLKSASKGTIIPAILKLSIPFHGVTRVNCSVSCGHWERLGELGERTVNIIDHLDKLLPKSSQPLRQKGPIGLVTFQNGIMNAYDGEFHENFQSIVEHFAEGTLCIGLYNQTTQILPKDMVRFIDESSLNMNSAYSLFHTLLTFSELIPKINPNLVWAHFAHSEAGVIANSVFTLCDQHRSYHSKVLQKARKFIKENLVTVTYGAVKPIPDDPVLFAINTYTNKDIALTLGKEYIDPNCLNGK